MVFGVGLIVMVDVISNVLLVSVVIVVILLVNVWFFVHGDFSPCVWNKDYNNIDASCDLVVLYIECRESNVYLNITAPKQF